MVIIYPIIFLQRFKYGSLSSIVATCKFDNGTYNPDIIKTILEFV